MAGRKKARFSILHLLFSILFIVLMGGGAWYFAHSYKPPTQNYYLTQAQTYLSGLAAGIGVNPEFSESKKWYWIDEDGKKKQLHGYQFLLGTTEGKKIGKWGTVSPKDVDKINAKFFAPLVDDIDVFFTQSKFVTSEENQKGSINEPRTTVIAYQRNKTKCIIKLTDQSDPFGVIFCGIYSKV